jgi:tRNA (adenine57-N1/adenine58-N1)-methyltransferase
VTSLSDNKIAVGNYVLLSLGARKSYLIKVEEGESFHTHKGYIRLDELVGKEYGTRVSSSLGFEFTALRPQLRDLVMKSARKTQITYPKDIALIVMFGGIGPGSLVVEAGTGTGALTTALAHYVRPDGRVYSYDIREEFRKTAERNLARSGLADFVELKTGDVTVGIDERDVHAVILDLAVPWLVVPHAYAALIPSGTLVSFSPTIDQVVKTVEAMREKDFVDVETVECIMRGMQIERGKTRPQTLMTAHTGYITFGRKAIRS